MLGQAFFKLLFVHIKFKSSEAKTGDVHVELYIYTLDLKHEKLLLVMLVLQKTSSSVFHP